MKNALYLLTLASVLLVNASLADVVINEINYNPPGSEDSAEFVELYNNSGEEVSLAGWKFNKGFDFVFPEGAAIAANGYVVVARYPDRFKVTYAKENIRFAVIADIIKKCAAVSASATDENVENVENVHYNLLAIYNYEKGTSLTNADCLLSQRLTRLMVAVLSPVWAAISAYTALERSIRAACIRRDISWSSETVQRSSKKL